MGIKERVFFLPPRKMRSYAAALAGATLGFIADNTRGAYRGYRFGRMAGYKRKRTTGSRKAPAKRARTTYAAKKAVSAVGRRKKSAWPVKGKRKSYGAKRKLSRKSNAKRWDNIGARVGHSYFGLGSGPRLYPGFKRTQQPTTFSSIRTQRIVGPVSGQQAVSLLPTYGFEAGAGTTPPNSSWTSQMTIDSVIIDRAGQWLQNYQQAAGSTVPGAVPTGDSRAGVYLTTKYCFHSIKYDQEIRNMSNQDVTIVLYDCILRKGMMPPTTMDPLALWVQGLKNESSASDQAVNNKGAGANPGGYPMMISATQTPFLSTAFCKVFKVKKTTKRVLASGAIHHHHINLRPANIWDSQFGPGGQTSSTRR